MKASKPAVWFIVIYTLLFYSWLLLLRENTYLVNIGFLIFSVLGGAISLVWLMNSVKIIQSKQRYFWFWIGLGSLFYTISNLAWFFDRRMLDITNTILALAEYFWLFSYIFFSIAFIYQAKRLVTGKSIIPVIFNIVIFMTVAISINIYYIMSPLIQHNVAKEAFTFMTFAYPIYNLGFLLAAISLYYLSGGLERKLISFFIVALFIQSIADFSYSYLIIAGKYDVGLVDPLWQMVILIFGLASIDDRKRKVKTGLKRLSFKRAQTSFVPYISVLVLFILVVITHSQNMNALTIGLSISFLLIIARQIFILRANTDLIQKYKELAHHDTLTGLHNRWKFEKDMAFMLKDAERDDLRVTLLLLDLNRFKYINETLGHSYGDRALVEISTRLKKITERGGQLYRVGGDEFAITFSDLDFPDNLNLLKEIVEVINQPFFMDEHEIAIEPSIGISIFPENGVTVGELVDKADAAMYFAKEKGNNVFQYYNDEINSRIARKRLLEAGLKDAITNNEYELYYQPQLELETGNLIGMEALIRWNHPNFGLISPGEFIPLAEKTGHIYAIGEWVLENACRQSKQWEDIGHQNLSVSVNVSAIQFRDNNFLKFVEQTIEKTGIDPSQLEIEITESVMQDVEESLKILKKLKEIGISVSIDDFGTGYSSLYMLRQLPIDTIKIDKSFIDDIVDKTNKSIVNTIINIGKNLSLKVIAEGIESIDQADILRQQGCTFGQGYLYSKPLRNSEFDLLLIEKANSVSSLV